MGARDWRMCDAMRYSNVCNVCTFHWVVAPCSQWSSGVQRQFHQNFSHVQNCIGRSRCRSGCIASHELAMHQDDRSPPFSCIPLLIYHTPSLPPSHLYLHTFTFHHTPSTAHLVSSCTPLSRLPLSPRTRLVWPVLSVAPSRRRARRTRLHALSAAPVCAWVQTLRRKYLSIYSGRMRRTRPRCYTTSALWETMHQERPSI